VGQIYTQVYQTRSPTVWINMGGIPVAEWRFFRPLNVAWAASRLSASAYETQHINCAVLTDNGHLTTAMTTSLSAPRFSMSEGSEWEPTTALIPSALSFSAFSETRTRAVILKAGKSGCSKNRERTEPPMYPTNQVVLGSDNINM
jgi:hypothetical protein